MTILFLSMLVVAGLGTPVGRAVITTPALQLPNALKAFGTPGRSRTDAGHQSVADDPSRVFV